MKKGHGELRRSQLITTFGPGSMLDLPRKSIIIAGIDQWTEPTESIAENRLRRVASRILGGKPVTDLKAPPVSDSELGGDTRFVRGFVFPEWFVTRDPLRTDAEGRQWRRMLKRQALNKHFVWEDDKVKREVSPIRFVAACPLGHVDEIRWHDYIHQKKECPRREYWMVERGANEDLSEIEIYCVCGTHRRMVDAMFHENNSLGACTGRRPWLGEYSRASCSQAARLLQRTASNAYYPQFMSVISIPEDSTEEAIAVEDIWAFLENVESMQDLENEMKKSKVATRLNGLNKDRVLTEVLRRRTGGPSGQERPVKEVEIEILRDAKAEVKEEECKGDFFARAIDISGMDPEIMRPIEKVVLVHRLREVTALLGFTRFDSISKDEVGEFDFDLGVESANIRLEKTWLPAIENRGEGIFLLFKKDAIREWAARACVMERAKDLKAGQQQWWAHLQKPGEPAHYLSIAYTLLHSLSHMLLSHISLECGYSASSIRERIYALDGGYGILLYTGTTDSEGTLGGLVEEGRRIDKHLRNALEAARICSNDPVCSQHQFLNQEDFRPLSGASCHGCLLVSETSCEQQNHFLDRALVIPTLERSDCALYPG